MSAMQSEDRKRWLALMVLCLGVVMIVLDSTIVNVALPSIREDLKFNEASLVWVVNAYMLTSGGFLLLGGKLGDILGNRRVFIAGIALFTLTSLICGLSTSQFVLVAARAVQGLGGAVVIAVALALIMTTFSEETERAKAMGVYGFVCAAGGSIGVVLGGVLTSAFSWHWIFLVNVPIGVAVIALSLKLIDGRPGAARDEKLDIWGAVTVTSALMLAVYAIVNGNEAGWTSVATLGTGAIAALLFVAFILIEGRVAEPLMPLGLFRHRNLAISNVIAILWAAGMFGWFFISALYMQIVLGYSSMQVGLAFLPADLVMAVFSLGLSAKLINLYGTKLPLTVGLGLAALGLALFAGGPVDGSYWLHIFPGMMLLGVGGGVAFNPMLLIAMGDVDESESGLASGIINTSFMMGGALGLAVLASVAAGQTSASLATGEAQNVALTAGYQAAFIGGAIFTAIGALLSGIALRPKATIAVVQSH